MHTADAAGDEDLDAGKCGADHRAGHGRGAHRRRGATGEYGRQVAPAHLQRLRTRLREALERGVVQTNSDAPVDHRDGGRLGAVLAHYCFDRTRRV